MREFSHGRGDYKFFLPPRPRYKIYHSIRFSKNVIYLSYWETRARTQFIFIKIAERSTKFVYLTYARRQNMTMINSLVIPRGFRILPPYDVR